MVYHILADGTVKKDITGHVVKMSDAETLYQFMSGLRSHTDKKKEVTKKVG